MTRYFPRWTRILELIIAFSLLLALIVPTEATSAQAEEPISPTPGTVWAWGSNTRGFLGDGTTIDRYTPVQVQGLDNVIAISVGDAHSLALKSNGTVWAWGANFTGRLGDGTTTDRYAPVQVQGLDSVIAISAGNHSLALKSDGTVWAWGRNFWGQLGDGTTTDRYTPVQVQGLNEVAAIATDANYSMALKHDGTVWVWGYNFGGGLGGNLQLPQRTPAQVSGLSNISSIVTGYGSFFAISDGLFWAWGWNDQGALGINLGGNCCIKFPSQIGSWPSPITTMAAGGPYSLGLARNGTVWAAGANFNGEIGNGTSEFGPYFTPLQVQGLSDITAVAAGSHSMALKSDGTVWAWGGNYFGNLGDVTTTNRYTPVQVQGLNGVTAIDTGTWFSVALISSQPSNQPPTADAGGSYEGTEGTPIPLDKASAADPDGDPLTYAWTVSNPSLCIFSDPAVLQPSLTCADNGTFTVELTVSDGTQPATDQAMVTVDNVAPTVEPSTGLPTAPIEVGTAANASASFDDPGTADTHTCTINWGDALEDLNGVVASGQCSGSYTYISPGVYTILMEVVDDDGGSDSATFEYVVVYDPSGGSVTGGGWIWSEASSCQLNLDICANAQGKANFGFVSKYKNGAQVPTGSTQFKFEAGNLSFHSNVQEWLVVNQGDTNAQFKGSGTINGQNHESGVSYKFMIWAGDGTADTFRIRIWWEDAQGGEQVVYDNGTNQAVGGGSIVIHQGSKAASVEGQQLFVPLIGN